MKRFARCMEKLSGNDGRLRSRLAGFTLIEILFAMLFLSILLLTIAMLVIHITTIYQKGLTIRAISSMGRELIDDVTRSIQHAPVDSVTPVTLSESDAIKARNHYYFQYRSNATLVGKSTSESYPAYGAFCTGYYSYLWNTAYALNANSSDPYDVNNTFASKPASFPMATYSYTPSESNLEVQHKPFKLLKIVDPTRFVCAQALITNTSNLDATYKDFQAPSGSQIDPVEMLENDEADLALYDMMVLPAVQNHITTHSFYSATFTLATQRGGVDVLSNGTFCKEPSDTLNTDFAYCAVNKFYFAVRATGELPRDENYGSRTGTRN